MNRSRLLFLLAATLPPFLACTAPDAGTHTARDVPDERAATATATPPASSSDRGEHPIPLADRMRALDKTVYRIDIDGLPAIGEATAPLTVVLFSDYECPYCLRLEPQLAQLRAEHGSDVRIVLAPRPLPFHPRARPAALAVIAAAEQGKVEPMHRALVALDGKLDEDALRAAAREAGLDVERFDLDRKGAKAEKTLTKVDELATRFSVAGTPTTFLNGRRITGAVPDVVRQLGEEQLAAGRSLVRAGTPAAAVYATIVGGGVDRAASDPSVSSIRIQGSDGPNRIPPAGAIDQLTKCWATSATATTKKVELTIGADGKVVRVVSEPPEHAACVTKAASEWTFKPTGAGSTLKFVVMKP